VELVSDARRISFGDNVLVRTTPETIRRGVAGLSGQVYGVTTPSVTGVEVIGCVQDDHALNVFLTDRNEAIWFAADLLECVDHAPGTEIRLKGVAKKWTRDVDGEWVEESVSSDDASKK
jgi:hypothetical protein